MSRTTTVALTAFAATALCATSAASAAPRDAAGEDPTPTSEAKEAGVLEPGDATMGWKEHDPRTRTMEAPPAAAASGVPGIDVSSHQGSVDWKGQYDAGKRFAYVKATEGSTYESPSFAGQYNGSYDAGFIRGAYHFALPDSSSGSYQANHFIDNGGGWSGDGKTLPGALDMEWNPYGATCYGKSQSQMRSWINDFLETYKARAGRYPAIYTNASWWNDCVGSGTNFGEKSPLWVARYSSSAGTLPSGWGQYTFWQYTDKPIDQNVFNGSMDRLRVLAKS